VDKTVSCASGLILVIYVLYDVFLHKDVWGLQLLDLREPVPEQNF